MNFRDAVRILRGLGLVEQGGAFAVGGEHEIDQFAVAAGGFLLDAADARAARQLDGSALGAISCGSAGTKWSCRRRCARRSRPWRLGQSQAGGIEQKARPEPVGEIGDLQHGSTGEIPSPAIGRSSRTAVLSDGLRGEGFDSAGGLAAFGHGSISRFQLVIAHRADDGFVADHIGGRAAEAEGVAELEHVLGQAVVDRKRP